MQPTILVRCVWPAERGPKNDCRGGTSVVWAGHGDVQPYPAALWPKLQPHPDVWQLAQDVVAAAAGQGGGETKPAGAGAGLTPDGAIVETARSTNTQVVVVTVDTTFTAEMLDAMPDQEIRDLAEQRGYGLHPRLGPVNLRARFLEAQDAAAAAAGQGGGETKTGPDGTAAGA